jgi:hypothetical protein
MFEDIDVKVDNEAHAAMGEPEVGEELCGVDGHCVLYGFDFDDHGVANEEIEAITLVELEALVGHGDLHLSCEWNRTQTELVAKAMFVDRFEQTWTEATMDFDRSSDDRFG